MRIETYNRKISGMESPNEIITCTGVTVSEYPLFRNTPHPVT